MSKPSLAQQTLVAFGKLAQRSDVVVERQAFWSGPVGRWKGTIPADMLQFYKELNGFVFEWRFADEKTRHGCLFLGLDQDGHNVIDPRSKCAVLPYQSLKACGEQFVDVEAGFNQNQKVLFFEGEADASGTLLFENSFWLWDNNGHVVPQGDSFTRYVQQRNSLGFCRIGAEEPAQKAIAKRLATKVELRKTFEVKVESVENFTSSQFRQQKGQGIQKGIFDKVMKALGRPERAKNLDEIERGQVFDEATCKPDPLNAKQVKDVLTALYAQKKTKKAFIEYFRCGYEPLVQAKIRIKYLGAKDQIPLQEEASTVTRVLSDLDLIVDNNNISPDIISYIYLHKWGIYDLFYEGQELLEKWHGRRGEREAVYQFVFEKSIAAPLVVGTYFSSALPGVMEEFER